MGRHQKNKYVNYWSFQKEKTERVAENIFEDIKDGNVSKMEEEANIQIKKELCLKKDQPKE